MGINIFSAFSKKQPTPQDTTYLALTLTPNKTIAAIWVLRGEDVQVLGIANKSFENVEALVHESAVAIDTAGKLAKSDVSQTVFGLSSSYFEGKNLSSESSAILKSLAEELDLSAQAYVSLASSISHYLKIRESVTPQVILIGSFAEFTEVHLVRNNQVTVTKTSRSEATIEKITQLVSQIKTEEGQDLPSRIIVYGAVEDSHFGKEITKKEEWKDIFVSAPKIDFLEDDQIAEAIAYSQAADVLGHDPILTGAEQKTDALKTENDAPDETQIEKPAQHKETAIANDMGFIEGEDILETDSKAPKEEIKGTKDELKNVEAVERYAVEGEQEKQQEKMEPEKPATTATKKGQSLIEKITTLAWLPNVFSFTKGSKSKKTLMVILACILIFLVGGTYIASRTLASVQIIIKANTQVQQGDFKVTAQRGGIFDASQNLIPGEEISASVDGNQKAVTTGTKNTGDKAKGQVKVFNWTTSPKTFSQGTVLISSNGVKFTLDSDIDVASRSASLPGEKQTDVTAQDFGTDGNISAASDLTFQQYDQLLYSAKNDNAFTGGDQKQITVVSQDDMDKLIKSLLDSLTQKAKANLKDSAPGRQLADDAMAITVTKKQFDKKLDDEASLLNLNMTVEAKATVYREEDLKNIIAQTVNQGSTNSLEARPQNIQITKMTSQTKGDKLILSGEYNADLVPKIADDDLKSKIAGKTTKGAASVIKQIPQVTNVQFEFSPKLFIFFTIPANKDKITFKIESAK
ncbi:MAG: hypothetical protein UT84_C0011G0017 [Candidatus Curtissbacteria bacterium GW2011_GWA1_40_16]|uniref:Baseplate protein J-like domain-containing protein n=1 Tax=Candidatus Curtissbacteria bacterium GW2011_GWA1_40_16 TaxID=1618405 RepID=A0A0G0RKQ6_9BACT|nr:MAG: hypothetical protein UT84_C0011G0017 [Candidatus Curtissbacteria bacterium GW2011_GWA1_40_16]